MPQISSRPSRDPSHQTTSDGGLDDIDNAIALCFDCHAWAGHYNVNHLKGFKYSPEFLRAARDIWHERVAAGPIPSASEDLAVQARYLISRDHDVSARLLPGDLSLAPIKDAVLANNEFGISISKVLRLLPHGLRRYRGDLFRSINDYLKVHPSARIHHTDLDGYAYYDCVRGCGQKALRWRALDTRRASIDSVDPDIKEGINSTHSSFSAAASASASAASKSPRSGLRATWVRSSSISAAS